MAFDYTTGVPNPPNSPSVDVVNMQQNTNTINSWVAVDHVGFNDGRGGTHLQSTYNTLLSASPTTSATQGAVFTNTIGSDIELMYRHKSNGSVVQLTGLAASLGYKGYQILPGGLIFQWGFVNGTHTPDFHFNPGDVGTAGNGRLVTFSIPFPNKIVNVTCNVNFNSNTAGSPSSGSAMIVAPNYFKTTLSDFEWQISGSGGSYTVFYWFAIGF